MFRTCIQKEETRERILIRCPRLEVLALHRHLSDGGNANFLCCSHTLVLTVPKTTAVAGPITGINRLKKKDKTKSEWRTAVAAKMKP